MKTSISLLAFVALGAGTMFAQESYVPTFTFKVGVPVTDMFNASNTGEFGDGISGSPFSSAVPRYEFGAGAEFHLPYHLRFEVDGLFKRGGFDSSFASTAGGVSYFPTTFNQWEIPGLIKTNIAMGRFRPFIDLGASLRHISTIEETEYSTSLPVGEGLDNNSFALHNRNSVGAVAGFGFTFKKGPFELTPEARYTRWANQAFMANGLRTNLDQGDVLLGIGF